MRKTVSLPTHAALLVNPGTPLIHRDLSWLQFNERVLAEAQDRHNPLLERLKFLSITASNLDEFFMIRYASIERAIQRAQRKDESQAKRLKRIRHSALEQIGLFVERQTNTLLSLKAELANHHINLAVDITSDAQLFEVSRQVFEREVVPFLLPPEEFTPANLNLLENLQLGIVYLDKILFRVPRNLPQVYYASSENKQHHYIFFLDSLLRNHLANYFRITSLPHFFRLTRDGDITVDLEEEDSESIPDIIRTGLSSREKSRPMRLQVLTGLDQAISPDYTDKLAKAFRLEPMQVIKIQSTLCLHALWSVVKKMRDVVKQNPVLEYAPFKPHVSRAFRWPGNGFDRIDRSDLLLHHPYDSFESFVKWIEMAADDKNVTAIQQTVYRMDAYSPVIDVLKKAAQKKTVRVIVELRARFDELNNLRLADELRNAGVEVIFGLGALKIHAKIALVTRQTPDGVKYYTHLSTGNYNATTARQYEDLAILTANQNLGADASHFFDSVRAGEIPNAFKFMMAAPTQLRRQLLNHIKAETEAASKGKNARIFAKVNALVDETVVDHLYNASKAGVQVDLIVRGACSLIPGVKGLSEHIRVISVVDRFLEHSRIYHFGSTQKTYLSSADWMPRNFFSRLELAFPILDPRINAFIIDVIIPTYLNEKIKGWELGQDGYWQRRRGDDAAVMAVQQQRLQFYFEELAKREYKGTPLE